MVRLELDYPRDFARRFGMNSLYAGKHWAVRKADADFWHQVVAIQLRRQGVQKRPFCRPVTITFSWCDRLDLSNAAYAAKMIEDALKGWVIVDDSKKYVRQIRHRTHDKKCILIEVRELEEEKE